MTSVTAIPRVEGPFRAEALTVLPSPKSNEHEE